MRLQFEKLANEILMLAEGIEERAQFLSAQYKLPLDKVLELVPADPTNGTYLSWITKLLHRQLIRIPEDIAKIREALTEFERLKKIPSFQGNKDINQYQTFGELYQVIKANSQVQSKAEFTKDAMIRGAKQVAADEDYVLIRVTTPEAGAKLFRHTAWCVKDPDLFEEYYMRDPEFFMVAEAGPSLKPVALIHFGSYQAMDVNDDRLEGAQLKEIHKWVMTNSPILRQRLADLEHNTLQDGLQEFKSHKAIAARERRFNEAYDMIMRELGGYRPQEPEALETIWDLVQEITLEYCFEYLNDMRRNGRTFFNLARGTEWTYYQVAAEFENEFAPFVISVLDVIHNQRDS